MSLRRMFYRIAALGIAISAAQAQPNVVFILTDDLGWGDLASYGNTRIETPNLDRLAARGTLFTQFYVSSPVCSPSRAAFLTGRHAPETGIHYAIGGPGGARLNDQPWLPASGRTLYDLLRDGGYRTGHFGKWHLGDTTEAGDAPPPDDYGIDVSATTNSTGTPLRLGGQLMIEDTLGDRRAKGRLLPRSASTEAIVESAMSFIADSPDQPFFVSLWTLEPHSVLDPTDEQMAPYLDRTHPRVRDRYRSSETVYYASVTNIDRQLGKLFSFLDDHQLTDDTIIVFTSDNGPSPLWSVATGHAGAGSSGPFRGTKASLYEGGIRVPFIVSWPGHVPQGRVETTSVLSAVDFLPTILSAAALSPPDGLAIDGINQLPVLKGSSLASRPPLFFDYRGGNWGRAIQKSPQLAIRDGDWKLLMNPDGSRVELHNLKTHPDESGDVSAYEPERVERMKALLLQWYQGEVPGRERFPHTGSEGWKTPKPEDGQLD